MNDDGKGEGQPHPDDEPNPLSAPKKRKGINVTGATLKEQLDRARDRAKEVANGTEFDELDI